MSVTARLRALLLLLEQRWVHFLLIACTMTALSFFLHGYWRWPVYLDNKALDYYFKQRGPKLPKAVATELPYTKNILMIETNHEVPRPIIAGLLDQLHQARAVAFDLMFLDDVGELKDQEKEMPPYQEMISGRKKDNATLSAAIKNAGNVIISTWPEEAPSKVIEATNKNANHESQTSVSTAVVPTTGERSTVWNHPPAEIWNSAAYRAHVRVDPDLQDQVVRSVNLFEDTGNGQYRPCLGLALAAASLGIPENQLSPANIKDGYFHLGNKVIPVDSEGRMLIDYVGGRDCFEYGSNHATYLYVLDDADPGEFKNDLVIFGEVSMASKEIFQTPYGMVPGMQIHANVLSTLLSPQGPPRYQPLWMIVLVTLGCSLLLVPPLLKFPLYGSAIVAGLEGLLIHEIGGLVFTANHLIIEPSYALIAITLTYFVIAYYEYHRARTTLGQFIGKEMVAETLAIFSRLKLGGRLEEATAFFCDLRGFSFLPSVMSTVEVSSLVNDYTSALVKVVKKHKGRPIDYQGDGVFVLFEQSHTGQAHARKAVEAALELRGEFASLAQSWVESGAPVLHIGIGIASGEMSIGIVGAEEHMKMGAVGNAVNTAARVQGLSQTCGQDILVTNEVYAALHDQFEMVDCGFHTIKGTEQPIELFGVKNAFRHAKSGPD